MFKDILILFSFIFKIPKNNILSHLLSLSYILASLSVRVYSFEFHKYRQKTIY